MSEEEAGLPGQMGKKQTEVTPPSVVGQPVPDDLAKALEQQAKVGVGNALNMPAADLARLKAALEKSSQVPRVEKGRVEEPLLKAREDEMKARASIEGKGFKLETQNDGSSVTLSIKDGKGQEVGNALANLWGEEAEFVLFNVLKGHRGAGLGDAMLKTLRAELLGSGAKVLKGTFIPLSEEEGKVTQEFYQKRGLETAGFGKSVVWDLTRGMVPAEGAKIPGEVEERAARKGEPFSKEEVNGWLDRTLGPRGDSFEVKYEERLEETLREGLAELGIIRGICREAAGLGPQERAAAAARTTGYFLAAGRYGEGGDTLGEFANELGQRDNPAGVVDKYLAQQTEVSMEIAEGMHIPTILVNVKLLNRFVETSMNNPNMGTGEIVRQVCMADGGDVADGLQHFLDLAKFVTPGLDVPDRHYVYLEPDRANIRYWNLHFGWNTADRTRQTFGIYAELKRLRGKPELAFRDVRGVSWLITDKFAPLLNKFGLGETKGVKTFKDIDPQRLLVGDRSQMGDDLVKLTSADKLLQTALMNVGMDPENMRRFVLSGRLPNVGAIDIPGRAFFVGGKGERSKLAKEEKGAEDKYDSHLRDYRRKELERIERLKQTPEGLKELREELDGLLKNLEDLDLTKAEDAREGAARLSTETDTWRIGLLREVVGDGGSGGKGLPEWVPAEKLVGSLEGEEYARQLAEELATRGGTREDLVATLAEAAAGDHPELRGQVVKMANKYGELAEKHPIGKPEVVTEEGQREMLAGKAGFTREELGMVDEEVMARIYKRLYGEVPGNVKHLAEFEKFRRYDELVQGADRVERARLMLLAAFEPLRDFYGGQQGPVAEAQSALQLGWEHGEVEGRLNEELGRAVREYAGEVKEAEGQRDILKDPAMLDKLFGLSAEQVSRLQSELEKEKWGAKTVESRERGTPKQFFRVEGRRLVNLGFDVGRFMQEQEAAAREINEGQGEHRFARTGKLAEEMGLNHALAKALLERGMESPGGIGELMGQAWMQTQEALELTAYQVHEVNQEVSRIRDRLQHEYQVGEAMRYPTIWKSKNPEVYTEAQARLEALKASEPESVLEPPKTERVVEKVEKKTVEEKKVEESERVKAPEIAKTYLVSPDPDEPEFRLPINLMPGEVEKMQRRGYVLEGEGGLRMTGDLFGWDEFKKWDEQQEEKGGQKVSTSGLGDAIWGAAEKVAGIPGVAAAVGVAGVVAEVGKAAGQKLGERAAVRQVKEAQRAEQAKVEEAATSAVREALSQAKAQFSEQVNKLGPYYSSLRFNPSDPGRSWEALRQAQQETMKEAEERRVGREVRAAKIMAEEEERVRQERAEAEVRVAREAARTAARQQKAVGERVPLSEAKVGAKGEEREEVAPGVYGTPLPIWMRNLFGLNRVPPSEVAPESPPASPSGERKVAGGEERPVTAGAAKAAASAAASAPAPLAAVSPRVESVAEVAAGAAKAVAAAKAAASAKEAAAAAKEAELLAQAGGYYEAAPAPAAESVPASEAAAVTVVGDSQVGELIGNLSAMLGGGAGRAEIGGGSQPGGGAGTGAAGEGGAREGLGLQEVHDAVFSNVVMSPTSIENLHEFFSSRPGVESVVTGPNSVAYVVNPGASEQHGMPMLWGSVGVAQPSGETALAPVEPPGPTAVEPGSATGGGAGAEVAAPSPGQFTMVFELPVYTGAVGGGAVGAGAAPQGGDSAGATGGVDMGPLPGDEYRG